MSALLRRPSTPLLLVIGLALAIAVQAVALAAPNSRGSGKKAFDQPEDCQAVYYSNPTADKHVEIQASGISCTDAERLGRNYMVDADPDFLPGYRCFGNTALTCTRGHVEIVFVYTWNEDGETQTEAGEATGDEPVVDPEGGSDWPAGVAAFTVIVGSFTTLQNAETRAQDVGSGAGILRTDDYPGLTPGYWAVFVGRYDSERSAEAAAQRERQTGVQDAFIRFVDGR